MRWLALVSCIAVLLLAAHVQALPDAPADEQDKANSQSVENTIDPTANTGANSAFPEQIGGNQDTGARTEAADAAANQLKSDAREAGMAQGFQCELCKHMMKSVLSKVVGTSNMDTPLPSGASDDMCKKLFRTSTMGADWTDERRAAECQGWVSGASEGLRQALSPFSVCKRMGHCGPEGERLAARQSKYNENPVQRTVFLNRPKMSYENVASLAEVQLPKLDCISVTRGPLGGGTEITVKGEGFTKDAVCLFDKVTAPSSEVVSDTVMKCKTPGVTTPGEVVLQIFGRNKNGDSSISEPGVAYNYELQADQIPALALSLNGDNLTKEKKADGSHVNVWANEWLKVEGDASQTNAAGGTEMHASATQDEEKMQPTFVADGGADLKHKSALKFSGNQRMRLSFDKTEDFALGAPSRGFTFIAVVRANGARVPGGTPFLFDVGTLGLKRGYGLAFANDYLFVYSPGDEREVKLKLIRDSWVILTFVLTFNEAQRVRFNGEAEWAVDQGIELSDLAKPAHLDFTKESGLFTIGGQAQVPAADKSFFNGEIADIRFYDDALDSHQLYSIEEELAKKYGVKVPVDEKGLCK